MKGTPTELQTLSFTTFQYYKKNSTLSIVPHDASEINTKNLHTWSFLTTISILTFATKLSSENSEPVKNTLLIKDNDIMCIRPICIIIKAWTQINPKGKEKHIS